MFDETFAEIRFAETRGKVRVNKVGRESQSREWADLCPK
jgi:hypothetical protein